VAAPMAKNNVDEFKGRVEKQSQIAEKFIVSSRISFSFGVYNFILVELQIPVH
jgi:hypothetical protein